jgi:tetratricopeptide (TPR) repeat protein
MRRLFVGGSSLDGRSVQGGIIEGIEWRIFVTRPSEYRGRYLPIGLYVSKNRITSRDQQMKKISLLCVSFMISFGVNAALPTAVESELTAAGEMIAKGGMEDARSVLEKLLAVEKQDTKVQASALNLLALIQSRQGRYEEARNTLNRALALNPGLEPAWENLGDVHLSLALQAYAQAMLNHKSQKLNDKSGQVRALLASRGGGRVEKTQVPTSETEVVAAIERWRAAWQARDAATYIAAYATNFSRDGRVPPNAWREERKQRLAAASSVSVVIEGLAVVRRPDTGRYEARFTENLNADGYQRKQHKLLELQLIGADWLIVRETAEK